MPSFNFRKYISPTFLNGLTFGDWSRLLWDNGFRVSPTNIPRILMVTIISLNNSLFRLIEEARFKNRVTALKVLPPLFIIGSARSGTTFLHTLLSQDDRFAYPNFFQVQFPHVFLTLESLLSPLLNRVMQRRRVQDNVRLSANSPGEDEFALSFLSLCSPFMGTVFPERKAYYDRYLELVDISEEESERWNRSIVYFLQKQTFKYRKPVILKSPGHSCRIARLLKLFPDARFLCIHRHPYEVIQSNFHAVKLSREQWSLQKVERLEDREQIEQYRAIGERYLSEKSLLRDDRLYEVAYQQLMQDPIGELRCIYEELGLPDFSRAEPAFRSHLSGLTTYSKNKYPELSPQQKEEIYRSCRPLFTAWGYSKNHPGSQDQNQ